MSLISIDYKFKTQNSEGRHHANCFIRLRNSSIKNLEYVKFFIEKSKKTKEYYNFLKDIFGETLLLEEENGEDVFVIRDFETVFDYRRLVVIMSFPRFLIEAYHGIIEKLDFNLTTEEIYQQILKINELRNIGCIHYLLTSRGDLPYRNEKVRDWDFSLENFKNKFFSKESFNSTFGFFLESIK